MTEATNREAGVRPNHCSAAEGNSFPISSVAFFVLVLVYCGWVFSLPLFPTQDGAVHLYYTKVLSLLLAGNANFSQFFVIRHPLPPYAVHYYVLLALSKFVDLLVAEKILVCVIIAGLAYGFRYLARCLGDGAGVLSFWAIPLALNWMLGMGFHSYCLSVSTAVGAMGLWLAATKRRKSYLWVAFLALIVLMLFTHPIPLFLVLAFIAAEILVRVFRQRGRDLAGLTVDAGVAAVSYLSLAYIALFVSGQRSMENLHEHYPRREMLHDFIRLKPLSVVANTFGSQLYRLTLYALLGAATLVALRGIRKRWHKREPHVSDLLLAGSLALGFLMPLLPRSMNGSDFFSDRLMVFVWILALAAAAPRLCASGPARTILIAGGCIFSLGSLLLAEQWVRPTAQKLMVIETAPIAHEGQRGIFVDSPALPEATNLTFDPFNWAGARYFRRNNSIMLNSPWLDLPILPLAPKGDLFANLFVPRLNNYPQRFRSMLLETPVQRQRIAPLMDVVVPIGFARVGGTELDPLMTVEWPKNWQCARNVWYFACEAGPNVSGQSQPSAPLSEP